MEPTLSQGHLITSSIDSATVKLHSIECYYHLEDDSNAGAFILVKHFLDIITTDSELNKTGWTAQNRRKWFKCDFKNGNSCEY